MDITTPAATTAAAAPPAAPPAAATPPAPPAATAPMAPTTPLAPMAPMATAPGATLAPEAPAAAAPVAAPAPVGGGMAPLPPPAPHRGGPGGHRTRTMAIVGGVAAALLVAGGVGLLVSRSGGGAADDAAPVTVPGLDSGNTTVPASVPTTAAPPSTSPATTAAPATTVAATTVPATVVIPTAPSTLPPPTTLPPATLPPATTVPATTVPAEPPTAAPPAVMVDIGNGVRVPVPEGYEIGDQEDGYLFMYDRTSAFNITLIEGVTMSEVVNWFPTFLADFVDNLETSAPEVVDDPTAPIVERWMFTYSGNSVSAQGGSFPIAGIVVLSMRDDGLVIVQDLLWDRPDDGMPPADVLEELATLFEYFVYG